MVKNSGTLYGRETVSLQLLQYPSSNVSSVPRLGLKMVAGVVIAGACILDPTYDRGQPAQTAALQLQWSLA